jgi:FkbM family methyltransferase
MNFVLRTVQRLRAKRSDERARFYAYLGPDLALTQLTDGHFIYVDPTDEQIAPHLIAHGYWERWIDDAIGREIRPGDRVVEVGANLGYYTLRMAGAIGPQGRLDAFEASPYHAGLLARSVRFNNYESHVRVHALAASDQPGELRFSFSRREGGSGHIVVGEEPSRETIVVPAIRLDDVIEGEINLLRMDAEGSEPLVLEGARGLLGRSRDVRICMEWGVEMMCARRHVAGLIGWLRADGFRFWLIATDGSLPELTDQELLTLPLNDILISRELPAGTRTKTS